MSYDLNDLKNRIAAVLKENVADWDAIPYLDIRSGSKYFTIWDGESDYEFDQSEQWVTKPLTIHVLAVAGFATEGYDGGMDALLDGIASDVDEALLNAMLRYFYSATYPTEADYITELYPRPIRYSGRTSLEHGGAGGRMIGSQWSLTVGVQIDITGA